MWANDKRSRSTVNTGSKFTIRRVRNRLAVGVLWKAKKNHRAKSDSESFEKNCGRKSLQLVVEKCDTALTDNEVEAVTRDFCEGHRLKKHDRSCGNI